MFLVSIVLITWSLSMSVTRRFGCLPLRPPSLRFDSAPWVGTREHLFLVRVEAEA
jgi:hypothetical protein